MSNILYLVALYSAVVVGSVSLTGAGLWAALNFGDRKASRPKAVMTYRESSAYLTEPTHSMLLDPWTPAEREAFGINDNLAFIKRVDQELSQMYPPRPVLRERQPIVHDMAYPRCSCGGECWDPGQ